MPKSNKGVVGRVAAACEWLKRRTPFVVVRVNAAFPHRASRQSRARAVRSSVSFRLTDRGSLLGQPIETSVQRYQIAAWYAQVEFAPGKTGEPAQ